MWPMGDAWRIFGRSGSGGDEGWRGGGEWGVGWCMPSTPPRYFLRKSIKEVSKHIKQLQVVDGVYTKIPSDGGRRGYKVVALAHTHTHTHAHTSARTLTRTPAHKARASTREHARARASTREHARGFMRVAGYGGASTCIWNTLSMQFQCTSCVSRGAAVHLKYMLTYLLSTQKVSAAPRAHARARLSTGESVWVAMVGGGSVMGSWVMGIPWVAVQSTGG